jgi:hypothetical protein
MNGPFARRPGGASPTAAALLALALTTCGGADAPTGPGSPSPSPSGSPAAGGAIAGRYLLRVVPGSGCPMASAVTIPMTAAAAGTSPHPGVQVLVAGNEAFEAELVAESNTVNGGFGTTEGGVMTNEATRLWIRVIGSAPVVRAADGRGEVTAGRMAGYVAYGPISGQEGALGACDATNHQFTLRAN